MRSIITGTGTGAGEYPGVPMGDGKPSSDRMSEIMRRKLLTGEYASNGGHDDKLIRAFRESKMSVDDFLQQLKEAAAARRIQRQSWGTSPNKSGKHK